MNYKYKTFINESINKSAVGISGVCFEEKGFKYELDSLFFTHRIKIHPSIEAKEIMSFLSDSSET